MGTRKISFINNNYYHIYNRGVDKRDIFMDKGDLNYFFNRLIDLNSNHSSNIINMQRKHMQGGVAGSEGNKLVSIVAYCLLPNHFHLLLKQESDDGVSKFMQKLGTSYTVFFNKKYDRSGPLFAGKFKAKILDGGLAKPTVSAYINTNYKHHHLDPKKYLVKSSIFEFLGTEHGIKICNEKEVVDIINEIGGDYSSYLNSISQYFTEKKSDNKNDNFSQLEFIK